MCNYNAKKHSDQLFIVPATKNIPAFKTSAPQYPTAPPSTMTLFLWNWLRAFNLVACSNRIDQLNKCFWASISAPVGAQLPRLFKSWDLKNGQHATCTPKLCLQLSHFPHKELFSVSNRLHCRETRSLLSTNISFYRSSERWQLRTGLGTCFISALLNDCPPSQDNCFLSSNM